MAEYVFNYDGWAEQMRTEVFGIAWCFGLYKAIADVMHERKRERIVRCRDCRYYDEIIHACDHPNVTKLRGDCPENWIFSCFDNDFCCWGKRKEVDDG